MNSGRDRFRPASSPGQSKPQRRLKTKPVLLVLAILLAGNFLWFIAWLIPDDQGGRAVAADEEVASVNGEKITRQEWMAAMEERHGRETLRLLVNEKVMATAAQEYEINVTDEEIDLELALQRSARENDETVNPATDNTLDRDWVKSRLILEKVLTKDVIVKESDVEAFYEENRALYDIKDAYRTRAIIVNTESEAEETIEELENGSSFEALARERSIDAATGSLGGDLGYITPNESPVDKAIAEAVDSVAVGEWSKPLALSDGRYAVITVTEVAKGRAFSFKEVAGHIKRELALEQLPQSITPEVFWKEFNADWFYGE